MKATQFSKLICILLLMVPLSCTARMQDQQADLKDFFQRLVQSNGSPLPKYEDLLRVSEQIPSTPTDRIASALPVLMSALQNPNDMVKIYAVSALWRVSQRADSAKLLSPYIKPIAALSDQQDPRLQGTPSVLFLNLKPLPPPEVVPPLLLYLKRTDPDAKSQTSAIFTLARIASENPQVIEAIRGFLVRPLDGQTRIGALNALGDSGVKDAEIIGLVTASLDDPDQGVRFTAAQTLRRMGQNAVLQADAALQKVLLRPDEAPQVKDAAKAALKTIGR
jgi:HEAT repeat protein